jgi:myo-inositol-1(or 4)-monophosphatase
MTHTACIKGCLNDTSQIASQQFGKVAHSTKPGDNNQVLTETDLAIGKYIIEKIKIHFPTYNVIDEEAGIIDNNSQFTWVIDPIDGTSNYAMGVPTYGIMLGLLEDSTPIAGGFALPATKQICIAEKGQGAFCNGERISVTQETKLSNCLVAYHIDGHPENPSQTKEEMAMLGEIILRIRNMRNSGTEPVDGLYVASGKYGGLLNRTMRIWDMVALHSIIEEAGGLFTDFWGQPVDYTNPLTRTKEHFTNCAASPVLHKQLQEIIQKFDR